MRTTIRRLALAATIGMWLVIVMGATVTNTGSATGCGRSWPLCHGEFIPQFAVSTAIEFSHRAVTGVEGILIVAVTAGVLAFWRRRREIQVLAPLMVGFLVLQAFMGAWAVMHPQEPVVLALHFGISLTAFASVLLTTVFLYGLDGAEALRDRAAPRAFTAAVWGSVAYVYFVVYLGAYVRHMHVELACTDWPLCNGQVFPGFAGPEGIVFGHRLAALGSVALLGGLAAWSFGFRRYRPDLFWGSVTAFGLVLLQSLAGALVVFTRLDLFSALAHAGIMALLFGAVSYLCFGVLPRHRPAAARGAATARPEAAGAGVREPA
jgi:cytochrome c oxidase assembly protein subunit 15